MTTVLCPACPTSGGPCGLCGDRGVVDQSLLYAHEPRIRRTLGPSMPVFEAVDLSWFTADDLIRTRDLIAAIPACIIAVLARWLKRCWA